MHILVVVFGVQITPEPSRIARSDGKLLHLFIIYYLLSGLGVGQVIEFLGFESTPKERVYPGSPRGLKPFRTTYRRRLLCDSVSRRAEISRCDVLAYGTRLTRSIRIPSGLSAPTRPEKRVRGERRDLREVLIFTDIVPTRSNLYYCVSPTVTGAE